MRRGKPGRAGRPARLWIVIVQRRRFLERWGIVQLQLVIEQLQFVVFELEQLVVVFFLVEFVLFEFVVVEFVEPLVEFVIFIRVVELAFVLFVGWKR